MSDFPDDRSVPDDAVLWRRIPLNTVCVTTHEGREIPSSAAFDDSSDGSPMSVALASVLEKPERLLEGRSCPCGVVGFTAGEARALGLRICPDDAGDSYRGHAYVAGNKTKKTKRALAVASRWVVSPEQARARWPSAK